MSNAWRFYLMWGGFFLLMFIWRLVAMGVLT